jgi:hypothetical protein
VPIKYTERSLEKLCTLGKTSFGLQQRKGLTKIERKVVSLLCQNTDRTIRINEYTYLSIWENVCSLLLIKEKD